MPIPVDPAYDYRKRPTSAKPKPDAAKSGPGFMDYVKGAMLSAPGLASAATTMGKSAVRDIAARGSGMFGGSDKPAAALATQSPAATMRVDPVAARPAPAPAQAATPQGTAPAQTGESPALTRLRAQAMQAELIRAKQAQYRDSEGNIQSRMTPEAEKIYRLNQEAKFAESAGRAVPGADAMGPPNRATSNMQAGFRDARAAEGALAAEWQRKRMDEAKYSEAATAAQQEAELAAIKNRTRMDEAGISGVEAETRYRNAAADKATRDIAKPDIAGQIRDIEEKRTLGSATTGWTPERLPKAQASIGQIGSLMSSLNKGDFNGSFWTGDTSEGQKLMNELAIDIGAMEQQAAYDPLVKQDAAMLLAQMPPTNADGTYGTSTHPGKIAEYARLALMPWDPTAWVGAGAQAVADRNPQALADAANQLRAKLQAIAGQ